MSDTDRESLLSQEYLQLQKMIEDFDGRSLTIKAWSVTFSITAIGFAYREKVPMLLLLASASAATFWLVDGVCKRHQRCFYPRVKAIESHFACPPQATTPFLTGESWREAARISPGKLLEAAWMLFLPSTALPHIAVVAAGIYLYLTPALRPVLKC